MRWYFEEVSNARVPKPLNFIYQDTDHILYICNSLDSPNDAVSLKLRAVRRNGLDLYSFLFYISYFGVNMILETQRHIEYQTQNSDHRGFIDLLSIHHHPGENAPNCFNFIYAYPITVLYTYILIRTLLNIEVKIAKMDHCDSA